jgi:hypothetical protein
MDMTSTKFDAPFGAFGGGMACFNLGARRRPPTSPAG